MLYWAEGARCQKHVLDFANSDEKMVTLFLKMLRKIYRANEKKLRVSLYCYANQDKNKLINCWSKMLNIPKSQFIKPYVRKDYDPAKKNKMRHGLVHIRYCDKKLMMQIIKDIGIIYTFLGRH